MSSGSPVDQPVGRAVRGDRDRELAAPEDHAEPQPGDPGGQPRREGELAVVVAHAAETGDGDRPAAGQRGDVQPVAGVVVQVLQVGQRGLGPVVVGQLEVAGLRGDDRLLAADSDESRVVRAS